jgi:integrase
MGISDFDPDAHGRCPWNAGNMVGAKRRLKPRDVWAILFFLDEHRRLQDRALFDLAIDSKLRGCDIVKMKIGDIVAGGMLRTRATVIQQKTNRPVQFELMTEARKTLLTWLTRRSSTLDNFIFPSRVNDMGHLSTRQ